LPVEDGALGIEADRQVVERELVGEAAPLLGIADRGHRVVVGDEVDRLAAVLERHVLAHGAEVVAEVRLARGLDAGEDAHHDPTGTSQCAKAGSSPAQMRSKRSLSRFETGPGAPPGSGRPSTDETGHTPTDEEARNASVARSSASGGSDSSRTGIRSCSASSMTLFRVTPASTASSVGVRRTPSASTRNTLAVGASASIPCSSSSTTSS